LKGRRLTASSLNSSYPEPLSFVKHVLATNNLFFFFSSSFFFFFFFFSSSSSFFFSYSSFFFFFFFFFSSSFFFFSYSSSFFFSSSSSFFFFFLFSSSSSSSFFFYFHYNARIKKSNLINQSITAYTPSCSRNRCAPVCKTCKVTTLLCNPHRDRAKGQTGSSSIPHHLGSIQSLFFHSGGGVSSEVLQKGDPEHSHCPTPG